MPEFNIDSFLDNVGETDANSVFSSLDESGENSKLPYIEPGYEGKIDYRIRQLSYSSLLTLHTCPREFQLYKLRTSPNQETDWKSQVTFDFGHLVGDGIQKVMEGVELDKIVWSMFLSWTQDLFIKDDKSKKSFWTAVFGVQRFISMREAGFLDEYELVYYKEKPATELSFAIHFPDGFRLRGFVDAVLQHKVSGKIVVLECKTTGIASVNPATYKNSAQAIGYSIVLDVLFPDLSSYEVLYLVYQTKSREFVTLPFTKTYLQRALWIKELLMDIETIKMYEEAEIYPMHGESCVRFGRDCSYFQTCTLSTEHLAKPMTPSMVDATEYSINLTLNDLIETQIKKAESQEA